MGASDQMVTGASPAASTAAVRFGDQQSDGYTAQKGRRKEGFDVEAHCGANELDGEVGDALQLRKRRRGAPAI